MKAANTALMDSATLGLMASTTGPWGGRLGSLAEAEEDIAGLCWGLEGDGVITAGLGLTATTGGGTEVSMGGSETSLRLSREISMEAVDMLNTGWCW